MRRAERFDASRNPFCECAGEGWCDACSAAAVADDATPESMLQDIDSTGLRVSAWEDGFLQSIRSVVERGRTLTTKQRAKLRQIWERC